MQTNLDQLGVDRLPVVNLRVMPKEEIGEENHHPLEEQLAAMQELVSDGLLEAFGVSNVAQAQARTAIDAGAVCVQNAYNLLQRDDEATLRLCAERGVAYVPFFPLGSAFPAMPKVTEDQRVRSLAEQLGATRSQIGLAWLLRQSDTVLLIPGTSSVAHLEENIAAGRVVLSDSERAELEGPLASE